MVLAPPPPYYRPMPKARPAYNQGEPVTALGRFIRQARDARHWSQEDVAAAAGENMTASEISNIELGRRGLPKPPRMIAIARAFDMHVCDLYVAAGFPEFSHREPGEVGVVGIIEEPDRKLLREEARRVWHASRGTHE